jgi:cell division protein FtsZ
MDRRNTLKWLGAAALGLSLPSVASQPAERVPIDVAGPDALAIATSVTKVVACSVIGVGAAGCNIVLAAWSSGRLQTKHCQAEFACVSMGRQSIRAVIESNKVNPGRAPVKRVQIGRFRAGGNVNVARAAARKHENALRSLIDGAEVVILVAGIGGGTGSAVAPILASMAQEAGALSLAVVVTPFRWELGRYPNAFQAVKELERECHYLASLSNQAVGEAIGGDATLDDVITHQEILGAACIHRLMKDGSRFCIDRRSRPT